MQILVTTGCQRSGTRFHAKHQATKHGYTYIDETDYDTRDVTKLITLINAHEHNGAKGLSIHGPAIKHHVVSLLKSYPEMKVYWLYRENYDETIRSMVRIGWARHAHKELEAMVPIVLKNPEVLGAFGSLDDIYLYYDVFYVVHLLSYEIGNLYETKGLVEMVEMESLKDLEGFRKTPED